MGMFFLYFCFVFLSLSRLVFSFYFSCVYSFYLYFYVLLLLFCSFHCFLSCCFFLIVFCGIQLLLGRPMGAVCGRRRGRCTEATEDEGPLGTPKLKTHFLFFLKKMKH